MPIRTRLTVWYTAILLLGFVLFAAIVSLFVGRQLLATIDRELQGRVDGVAVVLREAADGQIRVSFRAREGVDAAALAARFGGGGHRAASGATLPGPLPEATRRVIKAAKRLLGTEGVKG